MNLLIICGESSSDAYGAKLAESLRDIAPSDGMALYSMGSHALAKVTTQLVSVDTTQHSVSLGQWQKKRRMAGRLRQALVTSSVAFDGAVIVDFPGHNFHIAKVLQSFKISIATFITPNFWIWNNRRLAQKLANYSDAIITIFKKEYDTYSAIAPEKTHYWGHPLSLDISTTLPVSGPTIGLFPGSRVGEIETNLPTMLRVVDLWGEAQNNAIVIICENPELHSVIRDIQAQYPGVSAPITTDMNAPLRYAISSPGTITLRLALMGVPLTVVGYLKKWTYRIAKYALRLHIPFIGLPNIILNTSAFPEYIQPAPRDIPEISQQIQQQLMADSAGKYAAPMAELRRRVQAPPDFYKKIATVIMRAIE
jgi:lipid-A-disaccharide synthase